MTTIAPEAPARAIIDSPTIRDLSPATDRCDRCGAEAFVRVTMPSKKDLLFCGHHYGAHECTLALTAVTISDQRSFINRISESSA